MSREPSIVSPTRHSPWKPWANPIFRRYCQSRLRLHGLGVALLITVLIAGFIVGLASSIGFHRNTLRKLAKTGATVFVSSHILSELAEMCSSLCVMNRGRLLASGTVDQVRHQLGSTERVLTATLLGRHEEAGEWLSAQPAVHELRIVGHQIVFGFHGDDDAQADLMEGLIRLGIRMRAFEEKRSSFEDILVEVAESNRRGWPQM